MSKSDLALAVAVYDSHEQAEEAVRELAKSGFDMKTISILGKGAPATCWRPPAAWMYRLIPAPLESPNPRLFYFSLNMQ